MQPNTDNNIVQIQKEVEVMEVLRTIHLHRFERLQSFTPPENQTSLLPLNDKGMDETNDTLFYICWCSVDNQSIIMPLVQKIVSDSDHAIQEVVNDQTHQTDAYCMLTTANQYTIAGPLWAVASMHAFYRNRAELMGQILPHININTDIAVFCPIADDLTQKSYIAQSMGAIILLSIDPSQLTMINFKFLLEKISLEAPVTWEEFSTMLKDVKQKSGILEVILLEKMITTGKTEFAATLIGRNPKLLSMQNTLNNGTLMELIIQKDQLQILDIISNDHQPQVEEVIEEIVPKLVEKKDALLNEEQIKKTEKWHQSFLKPKIKSTPLGTTFAVLINFIATPLAFFGVIVLAGVGDPYIKNILAGVGIPTGAVPATLSVLVISSISVVLTERAYGLIDKQTTGSFILSAILPAIPGVPGGPRIQDSLGLIDRPKAIAEAVTSLVMTSIIGTGALLISNLHKWSVVCAEMPTHHLIAYVTIAAAVLNAFIIPTICKALYEFVAAEEKGR